MPKEKIAIISVLKPVNDTRAYEKMAQTLSSNPDYEIHIFGQSSPFKMAPTENIYFHAHSLKPKGPLRLLVRFLLFVDLVKLKPQLIICNTHELLFVTVLYKIIFGSSIFYDIQENYKFNLLYQGNYPTGIRQFLAFTVRKKERILAPFYDHFILAEKNYLQELSFTKNNNTVIENKAIVPENWYHGKSTNGKTRILFSGTITKSNGISRALQWMKDLSQLNDDFEYVIIGHCPNKSMFNFLNSGDYEFIEKHVSQVPIPHSQILEQIRKADFGLVCYDLNPSNQNCIPTKVYEYLALGLSSIFEIGNAWASLVEKHNAGICIDFNNRPTDALSETLRSDVFNKGIIFNEEVNWKHEESRWKTTVDKFLQSSQ